VQSNRSGSPAGPGPLIEAYPAARPGLLANLYGMLNDRRLLPLILLTPVLVFFIIWNTIPLLWLLGLSFQKYSLTSGDDPAFTGFANYLDIFANSAVWQDLGRTFIWVFLSVVLQTGLGLALGFLFWGSHRLPGRRIALTLLFAPMVLTPVATGTFFRLIYDPTFGILNQMMRALGLASIDFLGQSSTAFWAVLAVDTWMWTPFLMLMTLAALGSVPKAELEAAEIDQLPWHQRLRLVILHHGKFILLLGVLLRTIDSFKTMDLVLQMTKGGPGSTTNLVALTLYRQSFESFNLGWSSALAVILLLISIAFTSIFIFVLNLKRRGDAA
jgi:multiple sugar transport system permease protein